MVFLEKFPVGLSTGQKLTEPVANQFARQTFCRVFGANRVYIKNKELTRSRTTSFASGNICKKNIPASDSTRLQQLAEIELANLHEGNFARFQIRPSEFEEWKRNWG